MTRQVATGYDMARKSMTTRLKLEVQQGANAEYRLHVAIIDLLKATALPGVMWMHPANGGYRRKLEAIRLQRMGVLPGASDLFIIAPGQKFFAMEIKTPSGCLSEDQEAFMAGVEKSGFPTAVVRSLDEAAMVLRDWGCVRAVRIAA